jgi:hypothetical protein
MSQHIGAKIIDETYSTLTSSTTNFANFVHELKNTINSDLVITIDEYGLTILNKKQLSSLATVIKSKSNTLDNKAEMIDFLSMIDKVDYHQFLILVGD